MFQNRRHHSHFEFDFLHDQMVSLEIIFFVMASISVCFGLYSPEENQERLVESQALAAMAKALPVLQSYLGRNHRKKIYYEIEQYHRSLSSNEIKSSHELNIHMYQVKPLGPLYLKLGMLEKQLHGGATFTALFVRAI